MNEATALADPALCPNCYGALPKQTKQTPSGVEVCDDLCVGGWMKAEAHLEYLETVTRLMTLVNRP